MFFKSLIFLLLFVNLNNVFADTKKQNYFDKKTDLILNSFLPDYKFIGKAKYKYLFWDIYDASLVSETGDFDNKKFALILNYNKKISKESVIEETINELKKQRQYDEDEIKDLNILLNNTFKNIEVNDTFIAIKQNNIAMFYFEGEKVLETKDQNFISVFFNIWLRKDSQDPEFTKTLLGKIS